MVESIAILGNLPLFRGLYLKNDVSSNRKFPRIFKMPRFRPKYAATVISPIKAQAAELTKEAYSFIEKDRISPNFGYQIETEADRKPGIWPPKNNADNPNLHNPLLRQERMGCGWLGAIFEWEGVIVEYNPDLENQAWLALSREERKSPPPPFLLRRIEGMKNEQAISEVLCWSRDPIELKRLSSRKEEIYRGFFGGVYQYRPGSREFVSVLMSYKIPMALVSTRPRETLEAAVAEVGATGFFNAVVAAEDVCRGKPDPEMFVYAARVLGFVPERCVVFGNSNRTVEAAHEARMKCVAVAGDRPIYELGAADRVVRRLEELSVVDLKKLVGTELTEFGAAAAAAEMEAAREEEEEFEYSSLDIDDGFW